VTQLAEANSAEAGAGAVGVALLGLGTVGAAVFEVLDGRGGHRERVHRKDQPRHPD